jgi:hypothetical protein
MRRQAPLQSGPVDAAVSSEKLIEAVWAAVERATYALDGMRRGSVVDRLFYHLH